MSHSHSHEGDGSHSHSHDCHGHSHGAAPSDPELEKQFREAAEKVRKAMSTSESAARYRLVSAFNALRDRGAELTSTWIVRENSTENKTRIYSLFKQATQGDVQGSQPWMFEFEVSVIAVGRGFHSNKVLAK
jgi:hypothetical protein